MGRGEGAEKEFKKAGMWVLDVRASRRREEQGGEVPVE